MPFRFETEAAPRQLVYLARHGQAGGERYNQLTDLGREQAQLLGAYLAQNLPGVTADDPHSAAGFDYFATSVLERQKETLACIRAELSASGTPYDSASADASSAPVAELAGLEEIHSRIWFAVADELRRRDAAFQKDFEYWIASLRKRDSVPPEGRARYLQILAKVLGAWIRGEVARDDIEAFAEFHERVRSVRDALPSPESAGRVLLVSSGTPIALLLGEAMGLDLENSLQLLRWIYNTSLSVFEVAPDGRWIPVHANCAPHLPRPELRTLI